MLRPDLRATVHSVGCPLCGSPARPDCHSNLCPRHCMCPCGSSLCPLPGSAPAAPRVPGRAVAVVGRRWP